jgi:hypothetical protein
VLTSEATKDVPELGTQEARSDIEVGSRLAAHVCDFLVRPPARFSSPFGLTMLSAYVLGAFAALAFAVPNPQLPDLYKQQGGGGVPTQMAHLPLTKDGITAFQELNFIVNLEVAYFKEGAQKWGKGNKAVNGVQPTDVIKRVWAENEAWVEMIAETLKYNKASPVAPCQYDFPMVTDDASFFALANVITNIGIGSLINMQRKLVGSDPTLTTHISKIIGVKARHDAYFRLYAGEVPNPAAFETGLPMGWAYNMALDFIKTGTCQNPPPSLTQIKVYPDMALNGHSTPLDTPDSPGSLDFSVGRTDLLPPDWSSKNLYIAWDNGDDGSMVKVCKDTNITRSRTLLTVFPTVHFSYERRRSSQGRPTTGIIWDGICSIDRSEYRGNDGQTGGAHASRPTASTAGAREIRFVIASDCHEVSCRSNVRLE